MTEFELSKNTNSRQEIENGNNDDSAENVMKLIGNLNRFDSTVT